MKTIVTIGREYGSGGRIVAQRLAEKLGVPFYDKEVIQGVAKKTGFAENFVREAERRPTNSFMYDLYFSTHSLSIPDQVFIAQSGVIKDLADKGGCVIVGRCADYILREREDTFNVFVHAPMAYRADRIVRLYGESERSPEQRLQDKDKKRRVNYKHYTGRDWGVSQNYHLSLDSAAIGVDHCADVILYAMGLDPAKLPMPEGEKMEHT